MLGIITAEKFRGFSQRAQQKLCVLSGISSGFSLGLKNVIFKAHIKTQKLITSNYDAIFGMHLMACPV